MNVVLRELGYRSSVSELNYRGYDVLFCQIENKRCLVIGETDVIEYLSNHSNFVAMVSKTEKVPLYKQDMALRMGRMPQSNRETFWRCNIRNLELPSQNSYHDVWEVRG